jgi:hypothetical protein
MDEVDLILRDTIFEKYTIYVILICHNGKKIEFEIDMSSHGSKNKFDFGLNGPNKK